eukprot:TRINITY_DN23656_c0_g2_i1.p1 TRINITY_DN23656_c0_g2~~TRINITY_DN23656_c0_g2_i1.p1  ORF type:complete len:429 (-),score=64.39 TRINITY_DN23656_c0_g2_i1:744-2030(-)
MRMKIVLLLCVLQGSSSSRVDVVEKESVEFSVQDGDEHVAAVDAMDMGAYQADAADGANKEFRYGEGYEADPEDSGSAGETRTLPAEIDFTNIETTDPDEEEPADNEIHLNPHFTRGNLTVDDLKVRATAEKLNLTEREVRDSGSIDLEPLEDAEKEEYNMALETARASLLEIGAESNFSGHGHTTWPSGTIRYTFDAAVRYAVKEVIRSAIKEWERATCVKFKEVDRYHPDNKVYITDDKAGCFATVGHTCARSRCSLNLGKWCDTHGIALHELGHSIGRWHEHSRDDRDSYVSIHMVNIKSGKEHNFYKEPTAHTLYYYDYDSIMHYGRKEFGAGGRATITPRYSGKTIGQRKGLSEGDVMKVNNMYKCDGLVFRNWWIGHQYDDSKCVSAHAYSSNGAFVVMTSDPCNPQTVSRASRSNIASRCA